MLNALLKPTDKRHIPYNQRFQYTYKVVGIIGVFKGKPRKGIIAYGCSDFVYPSADVANNQAKGEIERLGYKEDSTTQVHIRAVRPHYWSEVEKEKAEAYAKKLAVLFHL